ncbi:hypothetical protein [Cohnella cellulosilytica]|uniref:hypothetical protein n=1 Tax=Cohnella cellulosilytica TaxID=986710 RepID=UPI00366B03DB
MSIKKNAPACNDRKLRLSRPLPAEALARRDSRRVQAYCLMISRDLYVPHTLHTRCDNFNSPH